MGIEIWRCPIATDELTALLERHGEELQSVPGVIGFAIGAARSGGSAIHVYVRSSAAAATAGAAARDLLGPVPVEVITMSEPEAQEG